MATPTILIVCPECGKKIKAPENVFGKKVRCKVCQAEFVAGKNSGKAAPGKPAKPAASKTAKPTTLDTDRDDDDDGKSYGLVDMSLAPRCPECANEVEEGQVVCLHCGYNLRTREYAKTRKVYDHTFGDYLFWLSPAIACVLVILALIGANVWYELTIDEMSKEAGEPWHLAALAHAGIRLWITIMTLFAMWFAGRFAFKRLILHPKPPEVEKVK